MNLDDWVHDIVIASCVIVVTCGAVLMTLFTLYMIVISLAWAFGG